MPNAVTNSPQIGLLPAGATIDSQPIAPQATSAPTEYGQEIKVGEKMGETPQQATLVPEMEQQAAGENEYWDNLWKTNPKEVWETNPQKALGYSLHSHIQKAVENFVNSDNSNLLTPEQRQKLQNYKLHPETASKIANLIVPNPSETALKAGVPPIPGAGALEGLEPSQILMGAEEAVPENLRNVTPTETPAENTPSHALAKIPGARPALKVQTEGPQWERTISAKWNGEHAGSVGYKVNPEGVAQVYGANVASHLRKQGVGTELYRNMIDDARANGAKTITSDPTNTSTGAANTWLRLKREGYPIQEITHPNGKPGFSMDLTTPEWAQTAEAANKANGGFTIHPQNGVPTEGKIASVLPEAEVTLDHPATATDIHNYYLQHKALFDAHPELHIGGYGNELNISAIGPGAENVAKKLDQESVYDLGKHEVIPTNGSNTIKNFPNYSLDQRLADLKQHPVILAVKNRYGSATEPAAMVQNQASFLHADGTISPLGTTEHPMAMAQAQGLGAKAAKDMDRPQFINETGSIRVRYRPTGRAGPELVFTVPDYPVNAAQIEKMRGAVGAMQKDAGGNGNLMIEVAHPNQEVSEAARSWPENDVKEFARPGDVDAMLQKLGVHPETALESPAVQSASGREMSVPSERTTGVHDAAIKTGGGIPGGIMRKAGKMPHDLILFHDPVTGSTLALPENEVTPENVANHLAESRAKFSKDNIDALPGVIQIPALPREEQAMQEAERNNNELPIPDHYQIMFDNEGQTWANTRGHEFGHAIFADLNGFPVGETRSHLHPENMRRGSLATQNIDLTSLGKELPNGNIQVSPAKVREKIQALLEVYYGGGMTQEILDGIRYHTNRGVVGDNQMIRRVLQIAGLNNEEQDAVYDATMARIKNVLTNPKVQGIIRKYREAREPGLPETLQASKEQNQRMIAEVREALNENNQGTNDGGEHTPTVAGSGAGNDARGKGGAEGGIIEGSAPIQREVEGFNFGANVPKGKPGENTISTRYPSAMKAEENPVANHELKVDTQALMKTPELADKLAAKVKNYPGLAVPKDATTQQTLDAFVRHAADNIKFIYNKQTPAERALNAQWYPIGANKIAQDIAGDTGLSHAQSAGVIAAQSPQKDWDINVSVAKRASSIFTKHQNTETTPEMLDKLKQIASIPANKPLGKLAKLIQGKKLKDLDGPEQALWIRLYDETNHSPDYEAWSPDGTSKGIALNMDGNPLRVAWGSLHEINKAVGIMKDGSRENISRLMGKGHKIRSFYNNIIDPDSPRDDVTADTHAVAVALLRPLGSKDQAVLDNFGAAGKSSKTGVNGTYPLIADAYRLAAKELDIPHPNQLQSIVWEPIRKVFNPEFKTPENKAAIDQIWKEHTDGKITADEAREQIYQYARRSGTANGKGGNSNNQRELSDRGVSGPAAEGTGSGAGSRTPRHPKIGALDFINALKKKVSE
jgi:predicted GNAT family acetyltransferase